MGIECNNSCCWVLFPIYLDPDCTLPPGMNKMDTLGGIREAKTCDSCQFQHLLCQPQPQRGVWISLPVPASWEERQANPGPKGETDPGCAAQKPQRRIAIASAE